VDLTSSAEQHGFQQGMQQGMQQGEAHLLVTLLTARFGIISDEYLNRIHHAEPDTLLRWGINLMDATVLEEVFKQ